MRQILTYGLRAKGGRNRGSIAVAKRSALVKRNYKFLDTKRKDFPKYPMRILKKNIYDPNRSANITLVSLNRGYICFVLACEYSATQKIIYNMSSLKTIKEKGSSQKLYNIPLGSIIYSIETIPGMGGKLIRSAGSSAVLLKKELKPLGHSVIKLKSGEHRAISNNAVACMGVVGNQGHFLRDYKKAGTTRLFGKRPRVRPSAMNPVDHPMGGRTRGGCAPKSKTGKLSHGPSTANKKTHNLIRISARKSRKQRIS